MVIFMRKNWFLRKETFRIPLTDSSTMFAWKGNPSPHLCLPNSFQQKWKIFKQPFLFSLQIHHLWSKSGFRLTTGIVFDKVWTPPDPKNKSCPRLRSRLGLIPNDSNSLHWNWIYVLMKLSLLLLIDTHYGACMWYWIEASFLCITDLVVWNMNEFNLCLDVKF